MRRIVLFFAVGLGGIALVEKLRGVETGDIDGDGYVTLADVASFLEGFTAAPGSLDGLEVDPCHGWNDVRNIPSFSWAASFSEKARSRRLTRVVAGTRRWMGWTARKDVRNSEE